VTSRILEIRQCDQDAPDFATAQYESRPTH